MAETRPLVGRELRRYEKRAARRYSHMIGMNCNRFSRWRLRCWRCLWWSLTGKHRTARRKELAQFEAIRNCPHRNRRPNPRAIRVEGGEICDDCGTGLVRWKRRP